MVQVPAVKGVTVLPLMVQTVVVCEMKVTDCPEEALALTDPDAPP